MKGWGWAGSVTGFERLDVADLVSSLRDHHRRLLLMNPSASQEAAWRREHEVLRQVLVSLRTGLDLTWGVVFEYELPFEGGRRPDVVLLAGRTIICVEFKVGMAEPTQAALDQVSAYARDLAEYHEATHGLPVIPVLVPTAAPSGLRTIQNVRVASPDQLGVLLADVATAGQVELGAWLGSSYVPLPTLVAAARRIFQHEPLPHVRRARSAGVPETVALVQRLAEQSRGAGRRSLVFVAGVPGSGKTLVGLRSVYEGSHQGGATFLSGNGPLVKVLQDALRSSVFVKDLHAYIRTCGINRQDPKENLVVFDEAQRAWDRDFMHSKRGIARSEPELLVDIGCRMPGWATLVGLVGDGQEIHSGEEGGMSQWAVAVAASSESWDIHLPPRLLPDFAHLHPTVHEELDLTISLRSREAEMLHHWVALLVEGTIELAARQAVSMAGFAFPMYLSRDLDEIGHYLEARYAGVGDARFGLLSSSHAKLLPRYGVDNSFMATSRMNVARWFNGAPDDPAACVQLTRTVTEFGCQGLELDMPVVCWGEDMRWRNGEWQFAPVRRKYPLDDPEQIVRNVYRVLLTRGRDGFLIYLPAARELDETAHALLAAGVRPLVASLGVAVGEG